MSEEKLPVKDLSEFFQVKDPPIVPKKIEGVKTKEELEAELAAEVTIGSFERVWYGVGKLVEFAIQIPDIVKNLNTAGLYAIVVLVLALVLYFLLK